MQHEYEERLAKIVEPKKYFEKSAELTEVRAKKDPVQDTNRARRNADKRSNIQRHS